MDAMSGRGKLGDRGLVADFYRLGGRAEYKTGRTGADGVDSIILDKANWAEYRTGADGADWWTGGRSGLRNTRWGELGRTGRTSGLADGAD